MEALWIAVALVVSVAGGWPVTAWLLKFAKSKTVRAMDAAEAGASEGVGAPAAAVGADAPEGAPSAVAGVSPGAVPPVPARPPATPASPAAEADQTPAAPAPPAAPKTEVLRGGLLIGFLERAAVTVAILTGQPVAIAYVVAIKGLGRYPELKDTPAASERFIIGTLASMLWAASVAVLAKALLL